MTHCNQNKKITSALRTRIHQVELEVDPINIAYGILNQTFKVIDEEDVSAKQLILWLATLSKKSEKHCQKPHNFVKKTRNCLKKPPNDLEKLQPDFSEEGNEKMFAGWVGVFYQNIGITAYTLENYSKFKNNSYLIWEVFLE